MTAVSQGYQLDHPQYSYSTGSTSTASPKSPYFHRHSSSIKTTSSAMTSVSSTSSVVHPVSSFERPTITSGKLHKRSHSSQNNLSTSITPEDDIYSMSLNAKSKKERIKPLLQRVSQSSGKLDLGKSDGGAGGVYSPYIGGKSSATDLTSFVPTHRQHHKRTISANSATSLGSTGVHPRRYVPTPNASYPNSIGDGSDSSDNEDEIYSLPRPSPGGLRLQTSHPSPLSLPPRIPSSETSTPISPMSPLARSGTLESINPLRKKVYGGRESSEEYVESILAARAEFEAREAKKEEKEEKKRRSFTKDREKVSLDNGGSDAQSLRPRWAFGRSSTPSLPVTSEKTIGVPYGSGHKAASTSHVTLDNVPPRAMERQYSAGGNRDRRATRGVKNQWLGFVVWIKFGMVKLSRKVQKLF